MTSTVSRSAQAELLNVFGTRVEVLPASSAACSVARIICPPGLGAPLHRHVETESFIVTRGQLTAIAGEQTITLNAGDSITISPWETHTFRNLTGEEAEFIALGTPGTHEPFFFDADQLAKSGNFSPTTAAALCSRHNIELVG